MLSFEHDADAVSAKVHKQHLSTTNANTNKMYNQNIYMLMDILLSNLKGICECASCFHGHTWGLTNNKQNQSRQ